MMPRPEIVLCPSHSSLTHTHVHLHIEHIRTHTYKYVSNHPKSQFRTYFALLMFSLHRCIIHCTWIYALAFLLKIFNPFMIYYFGQTDLSPSKAWGLQTAHLHCCCLEKSWAVPKLCSFVYFRFLLQTHFLNAASALSFYLHNLNKALFTVDIYFLYIFCL